MSEFISTTASVGELDENSDAVFSVGGTAGNNDATSSIGLVAATISSAAKEGVVAFSVGVATAASSPQVAMGCESDDHIIGNVGASTVTSASPSNHVLVMS